MSRDDSRGDTHRDTHLDTHLGTIAELTTGPDLVTLGAVPSGGAGRLVGAVTAPRRLSALAVLAPLVLWTLLDSEAARAHPFWVLTLLSAGAGLALATYVPLRGQPLRDVLGSRCAAVGGVVPLGCAAATLSSSGSGSAVLAGGFVVFALYQRLGNPGACRTL